MCDLCHLPCLDCSGYPSTVTFRNWAFFDFAMASHSRPCHNTSHIVFWLHLLFGDATNLPRNNVLEQTQFGISPIEVNKPRMPNALDFSWFFGKQINLGAQFKQMERKTTPHHCSSRSRRRKSKVVNGSCMVDAFRTIYYIQYRTAYRVAPSTIWVALYHTFSVWMAASLHMNNDWYWLMDKELCLARSVILSFHATHGGRTDAGQTRDVDVNVLNVRTRVVVNSAPSVDEENAPGWKYQAQLVVHEPSSGHATMYLGTHQTAMIDGNIHAFHWKLTNHL